VPVGSVAPGIWTGPLKVRIVFLFHSSARALDASATVTTAAQHSIFTTRMSFPPCSVPAHESARCVPHQHNHLRNGQQLDNHLHARITLASIVAVTRSATTTPSRRHHAHIGFARRSAEGRTEGHLRRREATDEGAAEAREKSDQPAVEG